MSALAVATFEAEDAFRDAVLRAAHEKAAIVGCWSPYPVEGLPETRGPHGVVTTVAASGLLMAAALYALQHWSAVVAYPFNLGARPLASWQAFLVAPIEFGALSAAVGGLVALIVKARLTRLNDPAFDIEEVAASSRDRFVIAIACADEDAAKAAAASLKRAGALSSRVSAA